MLLQDCGRYGKVFFYFFYLSKCLLAVLKSMLHISPSISWHQRCQQCPLERSISVLSFLTAIYVGFDLLLIFYIIAALLSSCTG